MKKAISIRLNKNETKIDIAETATNEEIEKELKEKIKDLKVFYQDEKTPILVTGKILKKGQIEEIKKIIKRELEVEVTIDSPEELGLSGIKRTYNQDLKLTETEYYRTSLRSGQKIENENSVVILGDVNSGAEVISGGNIVILGTLRGVAHAGAKGNQKAIIAASNIEAPQIRIANTIKEIEKENNESKTFAYIQGEKIIIE